MAKGRLTEEGKKSMRRHEASKNLENRVKKKKGIDIRHKELFIKAIPVPLGNKHDPMRYEVLPEHEASYGLIAPKGAGKTTLIGNTMYAMRGYFNSIIVFSPSVKNDDKWDWIKQQPLLEENKRLEKALADIKAKAAKEKGDNPVVGDPPKQFEDLAETNISQRKSAKFDARVPEECFMHDYTDADLKEIVDEQNSIIAFLKVNGYSKHTANKILFIFDDLVGSDLFSNARKSPFKMLNTNHRHLSASIMMVSQAFTEIPKTVRTNFTCLILFEIFSEGEIKTIMEEYPMGMRKKQWLEAYAYCVEGDHNFLFYDIKKPKHLRLMKNFTEVVFFKEEPKTELLDL